MHNGAVRIGSTMMDYVFFGKGEKKLVMLPGLSDGLATVRGKALPLSLSYRIFSKDYTVYMFSRKRQMHTGYTIREMAEDQAQAMRALHIQQADVLGVSQGSMIAQYLAIDHPELVRKLVLAVPAARVNPVIEKNLSRWISYAADGEYGKLMKDTAEKSYTGENLRRYSKISGLLGKVFHPKEADRFLINAEAILTFNALDELDQITCPTYVIAGGEDKTIGTEAAYEIYERIPHCTFGYYPDYGHAVYEEAKDFNERVYHWLMKE